MSDYAVAGPSGIKRIKVESVDLGVDYVVDTALTEEELAPYLNSPNDSFDDVSSDDEPNDKDEGGGFENVEDGTEEDFWQEAPSDVHDIVWSDPPLLNRENLIFSEQTGLKQLPAGNRPVDFFNLLVTDDFYNLIIEETNNYAEEIFLASDSEKARITHWKPLKKEELRCFLGLFLHTGTIIINRLQDYWKKHHLYNLTCFSDKMGRNRFLLILRCLHFARNPSRGEVIFRDRLHKIRPILNYFNNKMLEVYSPRRELSLDESMVSWKGRLIFHQYLPRKSYKYGIKAYVLAEPDGLTLKQLIYSGSRDTKDASTVVLQLMQENLDKGHSLYMDNFYNSHSLASNLLQRKTYCTGTMRSNRKNNCADVVNAKLRRGEVIEKCDEQNGLMMAKWRDTREVTFMSTEHSATLREVINRRGERKLKPEAILAYNKYMSGVDRKDLMLSYNACDRKTIPWYKKLGLNTLQILLLNSWYLYQRYSGDKITFHDFRLAIIEDLVGQHTSTTPKKKKNLPEVVHLPSLLPRSDGGSMQRKDCRVCRKNKVRKATPYCCTKCPETPGLCLEPCFRGYHNY